MFFKGLFGSYLLVVFNQKHPTNNVINRRKKFDFYKKTNKKQEFLAQCFWANRKNKAIVGPWRELVSESHSLGLSNMYAKS